MSTHYVKRAFEILRQDGVVELSKKSNKFLSQRLSRVLRQPYYRLKWRSSYPDPFRLIYVNPNNIEYYLLASDSTDWCRKQTIPEEVKHLYDDLDKGAFRRRKNIGRIVGGDWDEYKKEWNNNRLYQSLREVFVEGKNWEDTEYIQKRLEIIDIKGSTYGCESKDEFLEERIKYIEDLHQSIDLNGYLTQQKAPNDHRNKNIFHEVSVNIGRDGELIFNNRSGHHRLSLAKILDVDKIPVIVIARHKQWQNLRADIYNNRLSEKRLEKMQNHPDIQDIIN